MMMNWFLTLLLAPLISLFTFIRDWFQGFTITEILNRRLDFIATNILVTSFLTGFQPLFHIILAPFHAIIWFFKPTKKLSYCEKKYLKMIEKQAQLAYQNQVLAQDKKTLQTEITALTQKIGSRSSAVRQTNLEETAREEEKEND